MPLILPERGLYAVTPDEADGRRLLQLVEQALAGGAALVQYRAKPEPELEVARALLGCCRHHQVPLLINDDVSLAAAAGADGVHLGGNDMPVGRARALLGKNAIIGASCYDDPARAADAVRAGASYLAFGSVAPSPTKPHAVHCPLEVISEARRRFELPIAAIGGITLDNAAPVIAAGADFLAVISNLFAAPDVSGQARRFGALFGDSAKCLAQRRGKAEGAEE